MVVSIRDVAAAATVSVGTVSNVLNRPEKVAPATVERVQRAIEQLGFVRNDAARQLRVGRSRSIGLVVLDAGNPFFADVARGAEARADEADMAVLLGNADEDAPREARYLDLFLEQRVNGVLITPTTDDIGRLTRLRDAGTPVILVDREMPDSGFCSVSVDDVEGGFLAASHLLAGGRRRLMFLGGPQALRQVADRLQGARRAVEAVAGATLEVVEMPALTVLHGREAGLAVLERGMTARPDAIFAANDLLAVGAIQALSIMSGVRIPDDIALIGYDDIDFAASTVVPLSSIRQPASLIGYTAVDLLLAELADPTADHERNVRFQPELVVRDSTESA
ncbi:MULTISPECIES: LacI family DNA-binding transcriptional regulator [unclassified Microbacterium]|uniref:LacI family DNA-binding transcriptional regulator n=1 Tax=unclassified Microbacterium TaxID=2609290 RepID=UPI00214ABFB2|nr:MULTISPECIES: LacI family DNA-binding transcriptional regulator [unclassified Microbacterium]MCR2783435.1 LacI family transcriptional regulator [Microbacterium sp. zg.B96]MDL5351779.1 LacI family DNA-binding transcriptional regulator [Microbacterium sp. zg-YB36]WIM15697.1 LacI family DNA-binding transcriptional regulator [Microbacterium sp. zg-B96]